MNINIDKEIINRYKAEGLSIEYIGTVFLILSLLKEQDLITLDSMDDENKTKRMMLLYQYLNRKKLIDIAHEGSKQEYSLTNKGYDMASWTQTSSAIPSVTTSIASPSIKSLPVKAPLNVTLEVLDVKNWINEWYQIFPAGKPAGRFLRSEAHAGDCRERMEWFIKEYGYDKNTIMLATKAYINHQENCPDGHTYTRGSNYFIVKDKLKKDRTSDLAIWCRRILNGEIKNDVYIERDIS